MKLKLKQLVDAEVKRQSVKIKHSLLEKLKTATPVDTGEARDGWTLVDGKIVNDVDHILQLNEGHSQQAPAHFVERTLLSQPGVIPSGTIVRSI